MGCVHNSISLELHPHAIHALTREHEDATTRAFARAIGPDVTVHRTDVSEISARTLGMLSIEGPFAAKLDWS